MQGHLVAAAAIAVLAIGAFAQASPLVAVSETFIARGSIVFDGSSQGAFSETSSDPLVANPEAPGLNIDSSGDGLVYGNYLFALIQPSAVVFETAILDPYDTWTTLTVKSVEGQPDSVPVSMILQLPSQYEPTFTVYSNNDNRTVYDTVTYDTSNIYYGSYVAEGQMQVGGETAEFTRISEGVLSYTAKAVFDDPVMSNLPLILAISGKVTTTNMGGGTFSISDSDSWVIKSPLAVAEATPELLMPGKALDTTLYSGPIPEPGAYALTTLGLAAMGAALRRRRPERPPFRCGPPDLSGEDGSAFAGAAGRSA